MRAQEGHHLVIGLMGPKDWRHGRAIGRKPTPGEQVPGRERRRWTTIGLELLQGHFADVDMVEAESGGLVEAGPHVDAPEHHAVHPERISTIGRHHDGSSRVVTP
jgi:hypothetical protein